MRNLVFLIPCALIFVVWLVAPSCKSDRHAELKKMAAQTAAAEYNCPLDKISVESVTGYG